MRFVIDGGVREVINHMYEINENGNESMWSFN